MLADTTLYYFLFGSFVYWSSFLLCDQSMKKAISKISAYAIIFVFYGGVSALYFLTSFSTMTFIEYIIGFLPFIVIPLLYKDSVAKIIFTYFSGMLFSLMIHLISNIITNHIFIQVQTMNVIPNLTADMLFHIIALALMFIYTILVITLIKRGFRNMIQALSNKAAIAACLYPVVAFIILLWNFVNLSDLTNFNNNVITMITMIILLLLVYFVFYFVATKSGSHMPMQIEKQKSNPTQTRKEVVSDPMDLLTSGRHYYEMLLNHYMDMNDRTINLDSHLQTMNSLLVNDNIAGATVFMDRITQTFHDHDLLPVCNNQSINMLFSYYTYLCNKEGIYLETHIDLPSNLMIPDLDLCIVFGNLLENALEACRFVKTDKNRFINVDCKIQNGALMIIMDNSFDGFINKVNASLKSRKKFGGIGLKMVQAVVGKYRGTIEMEYPQNVFSIFVKLQMQQNNARANNAPQNVAQEPQNSAGKANRRERRRDVI